jgi:predicted Zn-dependent protease
MTKNASRHGIIFCAVQLVFCPGAAHTGALQFDSSYYSAGLIRVQFDEKPHPHYDYFNANNDSYTKTLLQNVEVNHVNNEVLKNIGTGKYQYALRDLEFALRYFPNHPGALQILTTIAVLSKNRALPIRYFEKALALYPSHALTHAQYGRYFVALGDLENGVQKLKYAIELDPKLTAGYVWLAQAYEKKGDIKMAREAQERARELGYTGDFSK